MLQPEEEKEAEPSVCVCVHTHVLVKCVEISLLHMRGDVIGERE